MRGVIAASIAEPSQRSRRDRLNGGSGSRTSSSRRSVDTLSAFEAKTKMFDLWTENQRTADAHLALMVKARPLLQTEAAGGRLPGLQLFRAYPALAINEVVSISPHLL